jgi:hypothetical protein
MHLIPLGPTCGSEATPKGPSGSGQGNDVHCPKVEFATAPAGLSLTAHPAPWLSVSAVQPNSSHQSSRLEALNFGAPPSLEVGVRVAAGPVRRRFVAKTHSNSFQKS